MHLVPHIGTDWEGRYRSDSPTKLILLLERSYLQNNRSLYLYIKTRHHRQYPIDRTGCAINFATLSLVPLSLFHTLSFTLARPLPLLSASLLLPSIFPSLKLIFLFYVSSVCDVLWNVSCLSNCKSANKNLFLFIWQHISRHLRRFIEI